MTNTRTTIELFVGILIGAALVAVISINIFVDGFSRSYGVGEPKTPGLVYVLGGGGIAACLLCMSFRRRRSFATGLLVGIGIVLTLVMIRISVR